MNCFVLFILNCQLLSLEWIITNRSHRSRFPKRKVEYLMNESKPTNPPIFGTVALNKLTIEQTQVVVSPSPSQKPHNYQSRSKDVIWSGAHRQRAVDGPYATVVRDQCVRVDERISIKQAPAKSAPPRPHPHPKEKAQKVLLPPVRHNGHEWPPIQQRCVITSSFF